MNSAIERLLSLRVKDIMHKDVTSIRSDVAMRDAAQLLRDQAITGAPVVDQQGRCVGILSASDFVYREAAGAEASFVVRHGPSTGRMEPITDEQLVSGQMSAVVQTVDAESPLLSAARLMCQDHIHRLVVVDTAQHPIGIVSTLDIVAAMIAVVEE